MARAARPIPTVDSAPCPRSTSGTARVKRGMAEMLKGGVIMDVVTAEQAKIAEDAGAVAVMALERVPADIRAQGGVSRMSDPDMIDGIIDAVSIPVMAKARIGHFVEAQVLQSLGVDYVDESEVLTPADYANHIDKWAFTVPVRLRRDQPGRGAAPDHRGRGDDPLQGRGRHRRRRPTRPRHMRAIRGRDPPADARWPRTSCTSRPRSCRRPYELVARGRRSRQAAGRAVHRRRHRHPGRRGDDDAARRRGRVRRLGHLQVRQPGPAGRGDRQGDHVLRRPGRDRQGLARARRGDGRHQRRGRSRSRTAAAPSRGW